MALVICLLKLYIVPVNKPKIARENQKGSGTQAAPGSAKERQKAPKSARKRQRAPGSAKERQEAPKSARKRQEAPKSTRKGTFFT